MAAANGNGKAGEQRPGVVPVSSSAASTFNPIRKLVDEVFVQNKPAHSADELAPLFLSIGDPTRFGNFTAPAEATEAVVKAFASCQFNGYGPSMGEGAARTALAAKYQHADAPLSADDVCVTNGCSGAIYMAISVLCSAGDTLLIPAPGFSLYATVASNKQVVCRTYPLNADKGWEVDLSALEGLIDASVKAIVVTNPSNPCGSVYSEQHLRDILAVAQRHNVPIIADEIYTGMTFSSAPPTAMLGHLAARQHPVISVGGMAKQYLVPGWRIGWILLFDTENNALRDVRGGVMNCSQLILSANSSLQNALPDIFDNVPKQWYAELMARLEKQALICYHALDALPGIHPIMPQGAMYMMARIDFDRLSGIQDDVAFTKLLWKEESVQVLPGNIFGAPGFFRVVITPPEDALHAAFERIGKFCARHAEAS